MEKEEAGIVLVCGEDGIFRKKTEPFAMIECETEADFDRLQTLLAQEAWHDPKEEQPTEHEVLAIVLCRGLARYEIGGVVGGQVVIRGAGRVVRWRYLPEMPAIIT